MTISANDEDASVEKRILDELAFEPRKILVPIDGSDNANRALIAATEIARKYECELLILIVTLRHNYPVGVVSSFQASRQVLVEYYDEMDKRSSQILGDAEAFAKRVGCSNVKTESVAESDSVAKQILEVAAKNTVDLIVIGTRGLGGFKKLLLGGVSSSVITHASCNVLVVR